MGSRPLDCVVYLSQCIICQFVFVSAFVQDYDQHHPSLSLLQVGVMVISTIDVFVSFSVQDVNNAGNVTFGCNDIDTDGGAEEHSLLENT
jgi:hypothetical protein